MHEKKIYELREKLYLLISEKAQYSEILRVSQELDKYIAKVTFIKINSASNQISAKGNQE